MLWNISTPSFGQRGCFSGCHTGEGKPFGNKHTPNPGELLDVQFTDLKKEYAFGVAVFDNAQVRHAYSPSVLKLRFE